MSAGVDGGGGGRKHFLSTHRCPEVDLLPQYEPEIPPPCWLVPQSDASEEEEEERSFSDWSEEDLSLHFSPSVILQSDDEDPESSFECVDVTMETLVRGQRGEGPKMVPKRQIQLKKVMLKDGPPKGEVSNIEVSANELHSDVRRRPKMLLRQHSMPASLQTDSCRINRGPVATEGFHVRGNSRQRLQKSVSLDETKTKMASCIIKSVLSKKMQAEQNNSKTSHLQKKPAVLPGDQQRAREGGKAVHVVRDLRTLVKNTYSLSFSTPESKTSNKVIGQNGSPPPSYQQAMGVKGHNEIKRSSGGHRVTASFSQSQQSNQRNRLSGPITQQRRGSEPIIHGQIATMLDSPTDSELSQSEGARGQIHQAGTSFCPPPRPLSTNQEGAQPPPLVQPQSSILEVLPRSSQQILHPCFHTRTALSAFLPILHPHMSKISYVHPPLSLIQTPSAPTLHLFRRSEENQSRSTGNSSNIKTFPSHWTRTSADQDHTRNIETPANPEQQEPQDLSSIQGLIPAGAGTLLKAPGPCHIMIDPKSGECVYVDLPPQPRRKMLLDPETGQYVQVFLPASGSAPNNTAFPVSFVTPAVIHPAPRVLSVMQVQPMVAMSLYGPPCLPLTLHTPSVDVTHTAL